jgi:hypothetical protein
MIDSNERRERGEMNEESPDSVFNRLRDEPGLSPREREALLDQMVARFPADQLLKSARGRLNNLSGADAEAILRFVEAFGDELVLIELAESLLGQTNLPAERAWEALALVDAAGLLEAYPPLLERWEDLNETSGEASLEELAAQLEEEPDGSWVALQGLSVVEPEVRAEIIAGLAALPTGPGLVAFLRLLTFAHDPLTRWAALDALDEQSQAQPVVAQAWWSIAETHPDVGIVGRARAKVVGAGSELLPLSLATPRVVRSLVTMVDGEGRSTIVLAARDGGRWAGAAFLCHVLRGVVDVVGQDGLGDVGLEEAFAELNEQTRCEVLNDQPEVACRMLAGSLSLCGPLTTPALRYWVERTVGQSFRADPEFTLLGDIDPSTLPFDQMRARARDVLIACPLWADSSDLTLDLAREVSIRGGGPPDAKRDAGAYRYLFEHRLAPRIELYQRMLLWNAVLWRALRQEYLSLSALSLGWQLSDPQHAVPSHPFFLELTTLSLETAPLG